MAKSVNLPTPGAADGKGREDGVHFARLDDERPLRFRQFGGIFAGN
jgi:hypothetical protein